MTRAKDISKVITAPVLSGLTYPATDGSANQFMKTDGSGALSFATVVGTTINNNADNRIITGSGTANTLEGESSLTYDGTNLDLADNKKIRLGTGNDLEIYHDPSASGGSTNFIKENSAIYTFIQANTLRLRNRDGSKNYINMVNNAGVDIYYNDAPKISTTSTGVTVNNKLQGASGESLTVEAQSGGAVIFNTNGSNERMRITSAGNLGLGATSVDTDIHIEKNSDIAIKLERTNSGVSTISVPSSGFLNILNTSNAGLTLGTNNTERMRIDSSGRVGIGNTVVANGDADDLVVGTGTGNKGLSIYTANNGTGNIYFSDGTSGTDQYDGYIAYSHSARSFFIQAGINYGLTIDGTNKILKLTDAGTERMRIDSSGNVGIGNTASGFNAQADNLIVGSGSGANGITIYSGSDSSANIFFADGTSGSDPTRGGINYNHVDNSMNFRVNDAPKMYITSTSGLIKYNGVYVYYFLGSAVNNAVANIDVTGIQSAGVTLVTAQYTHHSISSYGAARISSLGMYQGNIISTHDIQNITSSGGGSWTYSIPTAGTLRITKNAGSYIGSGFWWVKVETYYGP